MEVKVERYKGEKDMERGLREMTAQGWEIETSASRKQVWSATTGLMTRKQVHTVTFVRGTPPRPDL